MLFHIIFGQILLLAQKITVTPRKKARIQNVALSNSPIGGLFKEAKVFFVHNPVQFSGFWESQICKQMEGRTRAEKPIWMPQEMWNDAKGCIDFSYNVGNGFNPAASEREEGKEAKLAAFRNAIAASSLHPLWVALEKIIPFVEGVCVSEEAFNQLFRKDAAGNVVCRIADHDSVLGWQVDHFFPSTLGGLTVTENLHILNGRANSVVKNDRFWHDSRDECAIGLSVVQFRHAVKHQQWFSIPLAAMTKLIVIQLGENHANLIRELSIELNGLQLHLLKRNDRVHVAHRVLVEWGRQDSRYLTQPWISRLRTALNSIQALPNEDSWTWDGVRNFFQPTKTNTDQGNAWKAFLNALNV